MSHFFVTSGQITGDELIILGDDVNHMKNVLRMRSGEAFTAADENGMFYRCEVDVLDKSQVTAKILWKEEGSSELSSKIYLFQGLPKSDKMEMIIQKAVELGAQTFGTLGNAEVRVLEEGPVRAAVEVVTRFGASSLRQVYRLYADGDALVVKNTLNMQQEQCMLKLCFPLSGRSGENSSCSRMAV